MTLGFPNEMFHRTASSCPRGQHGDQRRTICSWRCCVQLSRCRLRCYISIYVRKRVILAQWDSRFKYTRRFWCFQVEKKAMLARCQIFFRNCLYAKNEDRIGGCWNILFKYFKIIYWIQWHVGVVVIDIFINWSLEEALIVQTFWLKE